MRDSNRIGVTDASAWEAIRLARWRSPAGRSQEAAFGAFKRGVHIRWHPHELTAFALTLNNLKTRGVGAVCFWCGHQYRIAEYSRESRETEWKHLLRCPCCRAAS